MELQREASIDVAMGYAPADTVITNGRVVNVHTGTVKAEGIAIKGERIAAVGDVEYTVGDRTEVIDAASETRRQAELGILIVIGEGSACKDIEACLPVITKEGYHPRAYQLCTDVITPDWMLARGQMDNAIRVAVQNGLDPMTAIQMSTIQPAEFYRVNHDMGMIAAGRYADIVFVETLEGFEIDRVMANGKLWVEGGKLVAPLENPPYTDWLYGTMNIDRALEPADFRIKAPDGTGDTVKVQCINARDGSLETPGSVETLRVVDGFVQADPENGINKICMIDRIMGTGEVGVAFVKGFGIKEGCIGTTANVFNQNTVLVGASDEDMAAAANETIKMDGGFIALRNGSVEASLPTPLNGLATDLPFDALFEPQYKRIDAWRDMGCELETPQMNLEFVSLVTIPYYRISTKGLAYMTQDRFELAELFVDEAA